MVLHTLTAIFTHWQQFLNTVLQLPSWTTASRAYCRILYKPDELQLWFWYPWALGPLWQATWDFLHEHLSSVMWALFSCGSVCWSHAHMEHCWLGITEAMAEVLRYWQIHHHNYQKKKKSKLGLLVLSFTTWCWAVECDRFHMQTNGGKVVM